MSGRYTRHGKPKGFEEFKKTMTYYEDKDSIEGIDHVTSWNAKGKFIWLTLDDGIKQPIHNLEDRNDDDDDFLRSIWITLGMSGRFVSNAFHESNGNDDGTTHKQARWYFEFLNERLPETKLRRAISAS